MRFFTIPRYYFRSCEKSGTRIRLLSVKGHSEGACEKSSRCETALSLRLGRTPTCVVHDQLDLVRLSPQGVFTVATLGGGLLGFNGGLTAGPGGVLYAIVSDFTEAGSLYTVQPGGILGLLGTARVGPASGCWAKWPSTSFTAA